MTIMEKFVSIRFKESTAEKFKVFSKCTAKTNSLALAQMLLFFEKSGLSPYEDCSDSMKQLERTVVKRIDGLIAILKNIEKMQTKPTQAMLLALLDGTPNETEQVQQEKVAKYREKIFLNPKASTNE
tara:strand:+ start:609 stop:989 length:381 start_codon:yes stop_codon:yes gene_type:complete